MKKYSARAGYLGRVIFLGREFSERVTELFIEFRNRVKAGSHSGTSNGKACSKWQLALQALNAVLQLSDVAA